MKSLVRLSLLVILFSMVAGCTNSPDSEKTIDKTDVNSTIQKEYVSTKLLSVKNDSWQYCGQEKTKGFIARVEMTGLQGQKLGPNDFIYMEPCNAEDDLGNRYIGGTTGIKPTKELTEKGSFIVEARFTPPLNPKAKKVTFSFELEPRFKIKETQFADLTVSNKDKQLEKGLVLEKVVQRPQVPDMQIIILQDLEDYQQRQFAEECYLVTTDGQRHSLRSLGASDPLPNGKVRNTLGFKPLPPGEAFSLVVAWQLPRENWNFSFNDTLVTK